MITVSLIVRAYQPKESGKPTFIGAKARGRFLEGLGLNLKEDENYRVKFTQSSRVAFPKKEGVYAVEIDNTTENDAHAWVDKRPESAAHPTVWISTSLSPDFTFKADLKKSMDEYEEDEQKAHEEFEADKAKGSIDAVDEDLPF